MWPRSLFRSRPAWRCSRRGWQGGRWRGEELTKGDKLQLATAKANLNHDQRKSARVAFKKLASKISWIFCLAFGLLLLGSKVWADDFASRRAAFLNYYDMAVPNVNQTGSGPHRIGRTGFWAAEGRFLNRDLVNGSNYMYAALGDADSEGTDAGFSMWPAMDCYLRWNAALPAVFTPSIGSYFKTQLTTNGTNYSSGATSNQRMMFATTHYLAGTVWGANSFPVGSQYQTDYGTGDPSGMTYVSNTLVNIPLYGMLEHDSLIYEQFTL